MFAQVSSKRSPGDEVTCGYLVEAHIGQVGGRRVPPLGRSTPFNADDPHSDTGACRRRGALIFLPVRSSRRYGRRLPKNPEMMPDATVRGCGR